MNNYRFKNGDVVLLKEGHQIGSKGVIAAYTKLR